MEGFGEFVKTVFAFCIVVGVSITIGFFIGKSIGYDDGITKCNNETIMKQLEK